MLRRWVELREIICHTNHDHTIFSYIISHNKKKNKKINVKKLDFFKKMLILQVE